MHTTLNATTHDFSESLGYPLWLQVNHWQHEVPLEWCTFNENEVIERGDFLYSPGIPLHLILTDSVSQSIPPAVLAMSESLPALQYQLLQAMQVSEGALELAFSAPLLFLLLVYQADQLALSRDEFVALVLQKRTEILRFCGLPATSSLKRLVARIEVRSMMMDEFLYIRQALQNSDFTDPLRHIPRLNTHQLMALRYYTGPFWPGFMTILEPVMELWQQRQIRQIAEDTAQMGATLAHLQGIDTFGALQTLHDRLIERRNLLYRANGGERRRLLLEQYALDYGEYPPPPLPGNEVVVPLQSWEELVKEGEDMRHCVSGYGREVGLQQQFIYQVLSPQRLTMALQRVGNSWQVAQVRGVCNCRATDEAMDVIKQWFVSVTNQVGRHG